MLSIISPSLTMKEISDNYMNLTIPVQIDMTKKIVNEINKFTFDEIRDVMRINDKLAIINKTRYKKMKFDDHGGAAILSYNGTVYKNIKASSFDRDEIEFCKNNIRILSGLYGMLRPYDSIYEYRLEMKTKIKIGDKGNLYDYFGKTIYENIVSKDRVIINLCSKEYSFSIEPYLTSNDKFITCNFKTNRDGILKILSFDAKAARGMMVNFIVKNRINNHEDLKKFNENGYVFDEKLSNEREYIFIK